MYAAAGARIRALRLASGLSQEEFAAAAQMNPKFLWRVEAGRQNLSLRTLARVSRTLGVSISELLRGIGPNGQGA